MELVIFIGLQASGKSTFYRTSFAGTHAYVSKDAFRNNRRPSRRQSQLIEQALQAGQSVVVDNTNPTAADRQPVIALGRAYGATIIGYYFESSLNECLERNQQRTGKARVPDVGVLATARKLEQPTLAEGFNKLFHVRIAGDSNFDVNEWVESQTVHDSS